VTGNAHTSSWTVRGVASSAARETGAATANTAIARVRREWSMVIVSINGRRLSRHRIDALI
jgi:hypothetical protein